MGLIKLLWTKIETIIYEADSKASYLMKVLSEGLKNIKEVAENLDQTKRLCLLHPDL